MKKIIISLLALLLSSQLAFAASFTAGKDYTVLKANAPKQARVAVIEFFNYGCPWCAHAEPAVEAWQKTIPSYIDFERVPVAFEKGWDTYSKAYFIAKALGIESKITPALFTAIHGKENKQYNDYSSNAKIIAFFEQHGVKPSVAQNAFSANSASLDLKVKQGTATMTKYKVYAIPTFVVGGVYTVGLQQAKSPERLLQIVNYLAALAHK